MPYDMYEAEDGTVGGGAPCSARTAPSATSPVRRPAARRSRSTGTGSLRPVDHAGVHQHVRGPLLDPGLGRRRRHHVDADHLRQRHVPQAAHADLASSPGCTAPRPARATRPAPDRGTSTTRRASCWTARYPPGARSSCRRTRGNSSHVRDRLHQPGAGRADRQPGPDARTSCRPASPTRTCRTRWTRSAWTPPARYRRLPARRHVPDDRSKFTIYGKRRHRSSAPARGTPSSWRRRTMENTDAGFASRPAAADRRSEPVVLVGNYTSRIDGPGKVWRPEGRRNITIDNVWIEHTVCVYWGVERRRL